tara:strand:+ start:664 stop:1533 length:870 start_codon:yes stop_codon:yes gene_type:complete
MDYKLLHELAFLKRDNIFKHQDGINFDKFSNRLGEVEQDPFIGFAGEDYEKEEVKVLFLGKSNAESAIDHHIIDRQINSALNSFRDLKSNYRSYANKYLEAMPRWNIMRFVTEFRNQTGLKLNQIAYANIVPWRYIGAPNNATYRVAFQYFTNQLIEAINPDLIIPLGSKLEKVIDKNLNTNNNIYISEGINREGRDKRIADSGWRTLAEAVADYKIIKEYSDADKEALVWIKKNPWFGKPNHTRATDVAIKAHKILINQGTEVNSIVYYEGIDAAVSKFCPEIIDLKK